MVDKSSDPVFNVNNARKVCQGLDGDLPSIVEENQNLFMSLIMSDKVCAKLFYFCKYLDCYHLIKLLFIQGENT